MNRIVLVLAAVLLPASLPAAANINMQEGQWEITSRAEVSGMPMSMPAVTFVQCMNPDEPVPEQAHEGQDCTMTDMKQKDDTVSWTVQCTTPGGTMKSNGSITYQGDTFKGTVTTEMGGMPETGAMGSGTMTVRMSGKRLGPCP